MQFKNLMKKVLTNEFECPQIFEIIRKQKTARVLNYCECVRFSCMALTFDNTYRLHLRDLTENLNDGNFYPFSTYIHCNASYEND